MSLRPCLRTGVLIVGGVLVLAMTACGGPAPSRWGEGAPSPTPDPSSSTSVVSQSVTAPAATLSRPTKPAATESPTTPAAKKTTRPPTTGGAKVTVVRGGGIAGITVTLSVEANGHWSYRPARGGKNSTGALSSGQRGDLQELLANPALSRERGTRGNCADGFTYGLTTGSTVVFWGDCGGGAPKTASAIVRLLTAATPL